MQSLRHKLNTVFFRHFEVKLVASTQQYDEAARIRHRVFSEECGFEPVAQCGRESDSYDKHSQQCLIYHRETGLPAACIRVIYAGRDQPLAIEDLCRDRIHVQYREKLAEHRGSVCEVSRFAVDPDFRRAVAEGCLALPQGGHHELSAAEKGCFSILSTVALLSALALAELDGRRWLFSVMEPMTPRLVRRSAGVSFKQAGESFEHHGEIVPFCVSATDAVDQLRTEISPIYRSVRSQLAQDLFFAAEPRRVLRLA